MIIENTQLIRFYYLMYYPSQDLLSVSLYNCGKLNLFNICAFLGLKTRVFVYICFFVHWAKLSCSPFN